MLQKNPYFLKIFLSLILFLVITGIFNCPVFSQNTETITISTYYPSPVGVYRELRAKRAAIGDTYYDASQYCWPPAVCAHQINATADLAVEGNVGIGTVTPQRMLHVSSPNGLLARIENTGDGDEGEVNTAVLEIKNYRAGSDTHRAVNFLDRWDYPVGQVAFNGDHVTGTSMWIHGARPGDTRVAPYADMVLDTNGNLGINTTTPQAQLDVSGGVKIGDDATCNANKPGTLRYNGNLQYCDGTNWKAVGGVGWVDVTNCAPQGGVYCNMNPSRSPVAYCQSKGYTTFVGACKAKDSAGKDIQGSLLSNNYYGPWAYACQGGTGTYWPAPPTEILCSS